VTVPHHSPLPDTDRAAPYRRLLLESTPRLLSQLDRESLSPTRGSFDRDHWSWKFRDFPVVLLQASLIPLSWLFTTRLDGNVYYGNEQLLTWMRYGLESLLDRQHRNGAFDTVGPNTQDHGITLGVVYNLATVERTLGDRLPAALRGRIAESIQRACQFAARTAEDYAFISNHHALYALGWHRAGRLLGDASLTARADDTISQIIAHQSSEGWYLEYGGADPGYESLGIHYLAVFQRDRPTAALLSSLTRAVDFYTNFVGPDGSVGGGYGSRDTHLWYPGGFELLGTEIPAAASIAGFLRARLDRLNVVTPRNVDAHNLPTLTASYCVALEAIAAGPAQGELPALPCEAPQPMRVFPKSGLVVAGTPHYRAVANLRKGGMVVVFDAASGSILHEDAGYVIGASGQHWTTALIAEPTQVQQGDGHVQVSTAFLRANREVLTPFKFLVLRALNLTLFRSVWLGATIRNLIIAQIITGRKAGPYRIVRRIEFGDDRVTVGDEVVAVGSGAATHVWRPRTYQAQHMGSARYFHPRELVSISTALDEAPETLAARLSTAGRLTLQFVIAASRLSPVASTGGVTAGASAVSDSTH
jgi:hypothetical protein